MQDAQGILAEKGVDPTVVAVLTPHSRVGALESVLKMLGNRRPAGDVRTGRSVYKTWIWLRRSGHLLKAMAANPILRATVVIDLRPAVVGPST